MSLEIMTAYSPHYFQFFSRGNYVGSDSVSAYDQVLFYFRSGPLKINDHCVSNGIETLRTSTDIKWRVPILLN